MSTYTIGDSFKMASLPQRYPDAKLAEELLFNREDIKGIWLSGDESAKYYERIMVDNKQQDAKQENIVIKEDKVIGDENKE